jgi:hypothetical protein
MGKGFGLWLIRTLKRTWMVVGRGSVRTGVSRPSRGQRVNPYKRTAVAEIATPFIQVMVRRYIDFGRF